MNRIFAIIFVGVFFLLPVTSSAAPPINLVERVAQLEALVASLQTQLNAETAARVTGDVVTLANAKVYTDDQILGLNTFVTALENYVTVDSRNHRITFTGVNLQLVNGTGSTYSVNGRGNFVVGYDGVGNPPRIKTGSHNLVIGEFHTYSAAGGFVAGVNNEITGTGASVSGGAANRAMGFASSVSGGSSQNAISNYSYQPYP